MLLESQYSQFKDDVNTKKPQGGANFITDFASKKELLSITHDPNGFQANAGQKIAPPPSREAIERKRKVLEEELLQNSDLPKF
ncbi:unnamed protein product [Sphagnum balticum]